MAPEFRCLLKIDEDYNFDKSDIFSIGLLILRMK